MRCCCADRVGRRLQRRDCRRVARRARRHDLNPDAVSPYCRPTTGRVSPALIQARGLVDIVIPRGGAGLINAVVANATVPTIETGTGSCHVYVHSAADLDMAETVVVNARPDARACTAPRRRF